MWPWAKPEPDPALAKIAGDINLLARAANLMWRKLEEQRDMSALSDAFAQALDRAMQKLSDSADIVAERDELKANYATILDQRNEAVAGFDDVRSQRDAAIAERDEANAALQAALDKLNAL